MSTRPTTPPDAPSFTATNGTLYLVPAPLDFGCDTQASLQDALPDGTLKTAARLTHWICENAKSTRAYLKRIEPLHPLAASLQQQTITELPREVHKKGDHGDKGSAPFDARPLLAAALFGHDMGLISAAGMPAVADPGPSVVRAAPYLGIPVVPLVGPVSLLLALFHLPPRLLMGNCRPLVIWSVDVVKLGAGHCGRFSGGWKRCLTMKSRSSSRGAWMVWMK